MIKYNTIFTIFHYPTIKQKERCNNINLHNLRLESIINGIVDGLKEEDKIDISLKLTTTEAELNNCIPVYGVIDSIKTFISKTSRLVGYDDEINKYIIIKITDIKLMEIINNEIEKSIQKAEEFYKQNNTSKQ